MNPTNCARSRSTPTASALYRDRDDVPTESLVLTDALPQAPNATWAEADIPAPQEQIAASGLTGALAALMTHLPHFSIAFDPPPSEVCLT
jgi:hypothetical protein